MLAQARKRALAKTSAAIEQAEQTIKLTNEIVQNLKKKQRILQHQTHNAFWNALSEVFSEEHLVMLCHEYANLDYCVQHNSYFARELKVCLLCSRVQIQKHIHWNHDDWLWYPLRATQTFRTQGDVCHFYCLNETEDQMMLCNLRSLRLTGENKAWPLRRAPARRHTCRGVSRSESSRSCGVVG